MTTTGWQLTHVHGSRWRRRVDHLLAECGVAIDGPAAHDIRVRREDFYARVLAEGSLGLGESYMDGWWDTDDLEEFVYRLLAARIDERVHTWRDLVDGLLAAVYNRQRRARAFAVGERHYDIGNDLYERMLDPLMIYSCAYWPGATDLAQAQVAKLELVFGKLGLRAGDRVLDVGCGWGGALKLAAERHGVRGVGITVSRQQADYARRVCAGLPIEIRLQDYRDSNGEFDHLFSIGMFEHVGPRNYRRYFESLRRRLRPQGRFLLHTIGALRPSRANDPWIERHIFPNSKLPGQSEILAAAEGLFAVAGWQRLGPNYVRTLREWRANFERAWPSLCATRSERFRRMWRFYLCSSAASFRCGRNDVWQVLFEPLT